MKIGNLNRTVNNRLNNKINVGTSESNQNFSDLLHERERRSSEEALKKLLVDIDEQGEKLSSSKNLRVLKAYKALIKKFMDEAIRLGISLDNQYSYDRLGRTKRFKTLKEIDKKLIELTNLTLQKETDKIRLLEQIGEIRGLLVNLYF